MGERRVNSSSASRCFITAWYAACARRNLRCESARSSSLACTETLSGWCCIASCLYARLTRSALALSGRFSTTVHAVLFSSSQLIAALKSVATRIAMLVASA